MFYRDGEFERSKRAGGKSGAMESSREPSWRAMFQAHAMGRSVHWIGMGAALAQYYSGWRYGAHSRSIVWSMRPRQMMVPRDSNSWSARDAINISSWVEPILQA